MIYVHDSVAISMQCPQCGAFNPEDARFCQRCGSPVEVEEYRDPFFYADSPLWDYYGNFILISGLLVVAFVLLSILL